MPRLLIAGSQRKRLILETVPHLRGAVGFTTAPILEKFETVGFKIQTLDRREAVVADLHAPSGVLWKGFRIQVDQIDRVAVPTLRQPIGPGQIFVIDEISEMLLHSQAMQAALNDVYKARASFLATVGDRPQSYLAKLRAFKGVVSIDASDTTLTQARTRVHRELGVR